VAVARTRLAPLGILVVVALLAALTLTGASAAIGARVALGSCTGVPMPADEAVVFGDVVFVGTVLRTENEGRWATVRVEERWKGSRDLGDTVEVRGGPEPGTATAVDRTFAPGRYLFFVQRGQAGLTDTACSTTQPWTESLARLRPADVAPAALELPTDPLGDIRPDTVLTVAARLAALLVALIAYLAVLRARRRPPDWIR
jgi:hypothetical protein